MHLRVRQRVIFLGLVQLLFIVLGIFVIFAWRKGFRREKIIKAFFPPAEQDTETLQEKKPYPVYKTVSAAHAAPPVKDNFPLAQAAHSSADLPPIPRWNEPRSPHVPERTPLFIGFTRNWRLLQQVVVSYITAGWPPGDIYVVENTGVLDANKLGQLSLQNPFFLNHTRLELLGVSVIITPTLLTFSQLQNFYLWTSTIEKYPFYFWSHMDVVVLSDDGKFAEQHADLDLNDSNVALDGYKSVYDEVLDALYDVLSTDLKWALRFFSYDRLALVNVTSFRDVGGWDTQIPFYTTDCDIHARLEMEGYNIEDRPAGRIWDVASALDDLIVLYRKQSDPAGNKIPKASYNDPNALHDELEAIDASEKELDKLGLEGNKDILATGITPKRDEENQGANMANNEKPTALKWEEDVPNSGLYYDLVTVLNDMTRSKLESKRGRNTWQGRQMGGEGEPFYRDSEGFEEAIQMTIEHGRAVFGAKWGHRDCDIAPMGLKPEDAWRVEKDWEE